MLLYEDENGESYVVYFAFGASKYEGNNSNLRCWDWGEALAVCMNTVQSDVAMYNSLSFKVWRFCLCYGGIVDQRAICNGGDFCKFLPLCYKYKQFVDYLQCCICD